MKDVEATLMAQAIKLAQKGDPSPNPHVGCVIADGETVVGEGFHSAAGEDHAEVVALKSAGERARGKTLYVTLEPCNHDGRTPPCVDAILAAGIARVVIGYHDPNPSVRGGGVDRLHRRGRRGEARRARSGMRRAHQSLGAFHHDGVELPDAEARGLPRRSHRHAHRAPRSGSPVPSRAPASRSCASQHDAVMVGVNTVLADNPRLTVRDVPGRNPIRVIVD